MGCCRIHWLAAAVVFAVAAVVGEGEGEERGEQRSPVVASAAECSAFVGPAAFAAVVRAGRTAVEHVVPRNC